MILTSIDLLICLGPSKATAWLFDTWT